MPQSTAFCPDLACLQANEGKVIDVDGTFVFPFEAAPKGHAKLVVDLNTPLSRREMVGTLPNRDEWALLV